MKKLFLFSFCIALASLSWAKTYDIKKLGADATGKKACTELINKTIDKASQEGGGTIYFPAGNYLTATIEMKSNITLHIESGATIRFSDNFEDYLPFVKIRWEGTVMNTLSPLIYAHDADNLTITGNITATSGTIGGFTIGNNSITAPNGVKLYSSGSFSTVNNLQLSSGVDSFGRDYAMLTQASGFDELRIMHSSGDANWGSVRFFVENGEAKVAFHSPIYVAEGMMIYNLPTTTQAPNLYIDAAGNLYRCTQ